ncbi:SDR family NAD(P)-dependent oxidoreductase [Rhizobium leguminosarum]|uniref:SDR family NAD(P)-dependent oxidoreductase n=1 Tax=Rhizobium leguminosarum TaxID=384 RepID=UPI0028C3F381|nr:SDR family NAD(P)-dependent oxidoreductase [Rhizobium leguminosarum]
MRSGSDSRYLTRGGRRSAFCNRWGHDKDTRSTDHPVTGASGGIGTAIVREIVKEGGQAIIHYGRDESGAEALLTEPGGNGWIVQGDLSTPRSQHETNP